jgi:hypothetical protein
VLRLVSKQCAHYDSRQRKSGFNSSNASRKSTVWKFYCSVHAWYPLSSFLFRAESSAPLSASVPPPIPNILAHILLVGVPKRWLHLFANAANVNVSYAVVLWLQVNLSILSRTVGKCNTRSYLSDDTGTSLNKTQGSHTWLSIRWHKPPPQL